MAEGFARHLGDGIVEADSAGIEAHGQNPRAIEVMAEIGIDISGQESTMVTDGMIEQSDLVVTVCGHADEHCPVLPPGVEKYHWPFDDPAAATGTEEEIMKEFRRVRDEIRARLETWLHRLERDRT
jgi:arsenate reductase